MEKINYHHGSLKEEMIEKGLQIINNEGTKEFSLRKIASMCGVSHSAPYKHFKDKEELTEAISVRILQSFRKYLIDAAEKAKSEQSGMVGVGKAYVKFMLENKEYFRFIFFSEYKVKVKLIENQFIYQAGSPFEVFCSGATVYLENLIKDKNKINAIILSMWSIVHGISTLVIYETFEYDGNYEELVERMLYVEL